MIFAKADLTLAETLINFDPFYQIAHFGKLLNCKPAMAGYFEYFDSPTYF